MTYLKIKGIRKSFENTEVLKGLDIDIDKGELVCFLGPSGCGKTTLLRIIAGLEKSNSGEVILEGKNLSNLHPADRGIAMVFQNYALFPNMNIYNNVAYGLKSKKINKTEIHTRVIEVLEIVGLSDMKDRYPSEISGGQQQRVALARAVVLKPEILLLDEPLSALDAKVRESLREEIKSLQRKLNITTILVTHDQEEALTMADKIVVFNEGTVMQVGSPEEIYYDPSNEFVADFIGKINFLTEKDGSKRFVRPECVKFTTVEKEGYIKANVKEIEFRGNIYRILVDATESGHGNIFLDVSFRDLSGLNIKVNDTLYLDLEEVVGVKKYA
ncbi:MAG: ATP-binding cassette domain-containing protein [Clostridium sp.]